MKTIDTRNVRMPAYALPLIFNGDNGGLNDEDMKNILDFSNDMQKIADRLNCIYDIAQVGEEEYFTWHPEFGLGCTVVDCVVLFMQPE
jgi:hypothetical protein